MAAELGNNGGTGVPPLPETGKRGPQGSSLNPESGAQGVPQLPEVSRSSETVSPGRFTIENRGAVYTVATHRGSPELWEAVGEQVLELHRQASEPIYAANDPGSDSVLDDGPTHRRYLARVQRRIANAVSSDSTDVVVATQDDRIVGFGYAAPSSISERVRYSIEPDIPDDEYQAMQSQTATVWFFGDVDDETWTPMAETLYDRLREAGCTYVTSFVSSQSAENRIAAHPGGTITRQEWFREDYEGPLTFTRVRLEEPKAEEPVPSGSGATKEQLTPQVSWDETRFTYDLPSGDRVIARFALTQDATLLVRGRHEYRQIIVTTIPQEGPETTRTFWRTYRSLDDLVAEGYPDDFFTPENLPGRTVEIATGDGGLVYGLHEKEMEVHGIDPWLASRQRVDPRFSFGFADQTGEPDESVNTVVINHMMGELREDRSDDAEPGDEEKAIVAEAARILKKDGRLAIFPVGISSVGYFKKMIKDQPFKIEDDALQVKPHKNEGVLIIQKVESVDRKSDITYKDGKAYVGGEDGGIPISFFTDRSLLPKRIKGKTGGRLSGNVDKRHLLILGSGGAKFEVHVIDGEFYIDVRNADKDGNTLDPNIYPAALIRHSLEHFKAKGQEVHTLLGRWFERDDQPSTNYDEYLTNLAKIGKPFDQITDEEKAEAARNTWTGRLAQSLGFTEVTDITDNFTTREPGRKGEVYIKFGMV